MIALKLEFFLRVIKIQGTGTKERGRTTRGGGTGEDEDERHATLQACFEDVQQIALLVLLSEVSMALT